jgi:hypothetical protein
MKSQRTEPTDEAREYLEEATDPEGPAQAPRTGLLRFARMAGSSIAALTAPETWPDYASDIGRFTPLRRGGLAGQTFEIEVAAGTGSGRPVFTRGYATITQLVTPDDPAGLAAWVGDLEDGLARYGADEPRAVPEDGQALVGFDLTTHEGHFMGSGHNRLLLYTRDR